MKKVLDLNKLAFVKGNVFYEMTKSEVIQVRVDGGGAGN